MADLTGLIAGALIVVFLKALGERRLGPARSWLIVGIFGAVACFAIYPVVNHHGRIKVRSLDRNSVHFSVQLWLATGALVFPCIILISTGALVARRLRRR